MSLSPLSDKICADIWTFFIVCSCVNVNVCRGTVGQYLVSHNEVNQHHSMDILSHVPVSEVLFIHNSDLSRCPMPTDCLFACSFRREAGCVSTQQAAHVDLGVDHVRRASHSVQLHADGVGQR